MRKNISSEFLKPLRTFHGKDLLLTHTGGPAVPIKTCEEYVHFVRDGYYAPDNYENKHELQFVSCFYLNYLKEARPSIKSYFPDQALPANLLNVMPPIIQTGVRGAELDQNRNGHEQDIPLSVTKFDSKHASLEDEMYYYSITIDIAGDLNGDGVEDLAGSICQQVKHGTYITCKAFAMTRCGPEKPMVLISSPSAPFSILSEKRTQCR